MTSPGGPRRSPARPLPPLPRPPPPPRRARRLQSGTCGSPPRYQTRGPRRVQLQVKWPVSCLGFRSNRLDSPAGGAYLPVPACPPSSQPGPRRGRRSWSPPGLGSLCRRECTPRRSRFQARRACRPCRGGAGARVSHVLIFQTQRNARALNLRRAGRVVERRAREGPRRLTGLREPGRRGRRRRRTS